MHRIITLLTAADVRRIRKKLKLKQHELAHLLGVTTRAIQNYESPVEQRNHREFPNDYARLLLKWEKDGLSD